MNIFLNKKILIYGLGKSGLSAFKFLKNKNEIFLFDDYHLIKKDLLIQKNFLSLKKISKFKFDFFQLYNVSPKKTLQIKKKFKKKIISTIQINNERDVLNYKKYLDIADIILFDSKGYEKSLGFDHSFLKKVPKTIKRMLAGDIKYNQNLDNLAKITDIIDISGSLETRKKKDISKINVFLKNINKVRNK